MAQPTVPTQRRGNKDDALLRSIEDLRPALAKEVASRQRDWAEEVGRGLACVELSLRRHLCRMQAPDGALAEVDDTRPSLVRQAHELRRVETELLEQCLALEKDVQWAADAFAPSGDTFDQTAAAPKGVGTGGVPDFGVLRERVERFLDELQKAKEAEAGLVLESVNTDLGAGD